MFAHIRSCEHINVLINGIAHFPKIKNHELSLRIIFNFKGTSNSISNMLLLIFFFLIFAHSKRQLKVFEQLK